MSVNSNRLYRQRFPLAAAQMAAAGGATSRDMASSAGARASAASALGGDWARETRRTIVARDRVRARAFRGS